MAKVTSKLQVTIPKTLADQYGIAPGHQIDFEAAGPVIRIRPETASTGRLSLEERLRLFDATTARQRQRESDMDLSNSSNERDWKREDLYDRG